MRGTSLTSLEFALLGHFYCFDCASQTKSQHSCILPGSGSNNVDQVRDGEQSDMGFRYVRVNGSVVDERSSSNTM